MYEDDKMIDYSQLVDEAMYFIVYKAMKLVEQHGMLGSHYFYISFWTQYEGVILSERIRGQHPEEMTIVLQHQFFDLVVHEKYFEVSLSFGGIVERIVVPFAAIVNFADPSIQFGLEFAEALNFHKGGAEEFVSKDLGGASNSLRDHANYSNNNVEPKALQNQLSAPQNKGVSDVVYLDEFKKKRQKTI